MSTSPEQAIRHFQETFLAFEFEAIGAEADRLIASGVTSRGFLDACLPCMEEIGGKFEAGEYYLPQLVVAGEMFKTASVKFEKLVKPGDAAQAIGQIVIGTPRGDIHDLGKDVFAVLAKASGFIVHDLGADVQPAAFIEKVKETKAPILGMSSLLTTNFNAIREVVDLLEKNRLRDSVHVIIGGGATEQSLVEKLKVDAQTRDAYEGIRMLKARMELRKKEAAA
jgi:methanogenic corrinoid protein MtbC1